MPAQALEDDDWVAAVSNMGAPLVGQKRLTDSRTHRPRGRADGGARQSFAIGHTNRISGTPTSTTINESGAPSRL
jgi:hypothetical protein